MSSLARSSLGVAFEVLRRNLGFAGQLYDAQLSDRAYPNVSDWAMTGKLAMIAARISLTSAMSLVAPESWSRHPTFIKLVAHSDE